MSTLAKINFEPVSSVLEVWRRDLPLAVPGLADPTDPVALVDGEWLPDAPRVLRWGALAEDILGPVLRELGAS